MINDDLIDRVVGIYLDAYYSGAATALGAAGLPSETADNLAWRITNDLSNSPKGKSAVRQVVTQRLLGATFEPMSFGSSE